MLSNAFRELVWIYTLTHTHIYTHADSCNAIRSAFRRAHTRAHTHTHMQHLHVMHTLTLFVAKNYFWLLGLAKFAMAMHLPL